MAGEEEEGRWWGPLSVRKGEKGEGPPVSLGVGRKQSEEWFLRGKEGEDWAGLGCCWATLLGWSVSSIFFLSICFILF